MKLYAAAVLVQLTSALASDCHFFCPAIYQPVCAVDANGDQRTFGNSCELNIANCDGAAGYKVVSQGQCPDLGSSSTD